MPIEMEAKFLEIDRAALRNALQQAGYVCVQPDYLMRRIVFDVPNTDGAAWARVRDEAGKVTVSYKRTHDAARADGTEEIEIIADHFETACALLEALGLVRKSYQETRREVWRKGAFEATLDEWPALPPFCEIEAPDESALQEAASELGFDWQKALFGPVGVVYERMGIPQAVINRAPRLTFDNLPEIFALAEH